MLESTKHKSCAGVDKNRNIVLEKLEHCKGIIWTRTSKTQTHVHAYTFAAGQLTTEADQPT